MVRGRERSITIQAYTEISMPVSASVREKSAPMSLRSPIGTNSEVLKIKAAQASPMRAIQCLAVILCSDMNIIYTTN